MANNTSKVNDVTALQFIADYLKDKYEGDQGELLHSYLVNYQVPLHPAQHNMLHSISNETGLRPDVVSRWLLTAALADVYKALDWPIDGYAPNDLDIVKDTWKKDNPSKTCKVLD